MRAIFSVLGLLLVVLIVGSLARKQLTAASAPSTAAAPETASVPAGTPRQQVQQFQQALQESMQAPRPEPDAK